MTDVAFACDAMLGALARWLRLAGFDTAYDTGLDEAALGALARREGRWLLTCDRRLASAAGPRVVLLERVDLGAQVAELRRRLPLTVDPTRFFSRCSRCNGVLRAVDRRDVAGRVPPYVATHAAAFKVCTGCGRIYWPGTHAVRIARTLESLFGPETSP